jgi:phosphoglycerate dehydrogenase-like enzyme
MSAKPIDVLIHYPLSEEQQRELAAVSPQVRLAIFPEGDAKKIPPEVLEKTEVLLTSNFAPDPEAAPQLQWIQFSYAGLDFFHQHPLLQRAGFNATSLSGAASPKVAEFALMGLLALAHKLPMMMQYQLEKIWPPDRWTRFQPRELRGSTIGMLGYGSIARELARLLQPFGATILATKHDLGDIRQRGYIPEGTGDPEGELFSRLYPPEALHSMLKLSDFVVITLPLTQSTRSIIGAKELQIMKPSAYLISVGRGGQVEEDALLIALKEKKIAGAMLDVFSVEPLPKDHPLWEAPNLVITPHIAGDTGNYNQLVFELFAENLKRYIAGKDLLNVFDPDRGY